MTMDDVDIYSVIRLTAFLAIAWVVQVIGLGTFSSETRSGPQRVNIVDFETDFKKEEMDRSMVEIAHERGWSMSAPFMGPEQARELARAHERKKWIALTAGLGGLVGVYVTAFKLWGRWLIALSCILLGPVGIAQALFVYHRRR